MALRVLMYSFKGGAGRTVTTANVAYTMASALARKILIVDLDMESAGAAVLFGTDGSLEKSLDALSIQDILRETPSQKLLAERTFSTTWERSYRAFHDSTTTPEPQEESLPNLRLLPARRILKTTNEPVFGSEPMRGDFRLLLKRIETHWSPDVIFMDSASGIQQSALMGIMSADVIIIFARWSRQFMLGTSQFVEEQLAVTAPNLPRLKRVLIIPTAVPAVDEERMRNLEREVARLNNSASMKAGTPQDWIRIGPSIPESQELKWDDFIFSTVRPTKDVALKAAYRSLADTILDLNKS